MVALSFFFPCRFYEISFFLYNYWAKSKKKKSEITVLNYKMTEVYNLYSIQD